MEKIVVGIILVMLVTGCESEMKQESTVLENKQSKLQKYMFSSDPLVEKTYRDCINSLMEVCQPVRGMTFKQLEKLRTLESGSFKGRLDWRDSDGSEQWSEEFRYKNFTRVYTFENGRLVEWVDISH